MFQGKADMGPSRKRPVGVGAVASYEHIRNCRHCGKGRPQEFCEEYLALVRDFARAGERQAPASSETIESAHDRVPTVEVPVTPMRDLVFGDGAGL